MSLQPNRDLSLLQPSFRKKVEWFLSEAKQVFVTEGYRSQARQDYLYSLGRTRPWKKVTRTLNSNHTKGIAIDIAFKGWALYPSDIRERTDVANIATKYGIAWWYDLWGIDKPHFQDNWKEDISLIEKKLASEVKNLNSKLRDETQDVTLRNLLNKMNNYLRSKYGF